MSEKVLVIDDEEKIRRIITHLLTEEGFQVKAAQDGMNGYRTALRFSPRIILMDQNMPGMNGIETMQKILEKLPEVTVIIITAFGEVSLAVEAIKKGAYDYIEKPFDNDKLILLIKRALAYNRMSGEISELKQKLDVKDSFEKIITASLKMKQVIDRAKSVSQTDATVLITGESGVGKEMFASAIHNSSPRKNKPMITLNCGAIPVTLMESELFGHEKGAFTDAREMKQGRFELANGGSLFLDEITELSLEAQVKLLRVLDDHRITRIGGKKDIPADVRIISATNDNVEEKVQKREFRLDLLYRLNIFTLDIPPLRERKEDIPLLTEAFINKYNREFKLNITNISRQALDYLMKYSWPGNVRDLQNAIQSAMILAGTGILSTGHLPLRLKGYTETEDHGTNLDAGLDKNIRIHHSRIEKELIREALNQCNYNRTETAKLLKISRKTLFNKMKSYGL
jgi:DNA-binding NtrC family response regulator